MIRGRRVLDRLSQRREALRQHDFDYGHVAVSPSKPGHGLDEIDLHTTMRSTMFTLDCASSRVHPVDDFAPCW